MSNPKLSEIRARGWAHSDTRHLLDLVERMGKALGHSNDAIETAICNVDGLDGADGQKVLKEARALLLEIKE